MTFRFFFNDLSNKAKSVVREAVARRMENEIWDVSEHAGVDLEEARDMVIDDFLNRHNFGFMVEL